MPIPYSIDCDVCGEPVDITNRESDEDGDVFLKISPCQSCLDGSYDEGYQKGESDNA
jgi:hypothetical protein